MQMLIKKYYIYYQILIGFIILNSSIINAQELQVNKNNKKKSFFSQILNHKKKSSAHFEQKYYFYSHPNATLESPVFYMLGNESAITPYYLSSTIMKTLADTFLGHAVILEHRFYGESIPGKTLTNDNLNNLSTEEALADFANFQDEFTRIKKLSGKWISVGSSYASNLSAYYLLNYPKKIAGAIVSSAPLATSPFNYSMDTLVAMELGPDCLKSIQRRIADIKLNLPDSKYRKAFNDKTGSLRIQDDRSIFFAIADILTMLTQRGRIKKSCELLKQTQGIDGLIAALEVLTGPNLNLYENSLELAFETEIDIHNKGVGVRQWYYQACSEYGLWQLPSLDESIQFRDTSVNEGYYDWFCKKAYGIHARTRPDKQLQKYAMRVARKKNLNILIINGEHDPWAQLSLRHNLVEGSQVEIYNQEEGYHGTGIGAPRLNESADSPALNARKRMIQSSKKWIDKFE